MRSIDRAYSRCRRQFYGRRRKWPRGPHLAIPEAWFLEARDAQLFTVRVAQEFAFSLKTGMRMREKHGAGRTSSKELDPALLRLWTGPQPLPAFLTAVSNAWLH